MHAAAGASHQFLYLPMRRWLIRLLGHRSVQALEEVADASVEVSSTSSSTAPLIFQPNRRSRLLERLRSRPYTYAQVAQLAAQAAQVAVAQKFFFIGFHLSFPLVFSIII